VKYGFKEQIDALEAAQCWCKLDQSKPFRSYPFSALDARLQHWVMAIASANGNDSLGIQSMALFLPNTA
jgi:hypothetical protein